MKDKIAEKLEKTQAEQEEEKDTTTSVVNNTVSDDDDDADLFACIEDRFSLLIRKRSALALTEAGRFFYGIKIVCFVITAAHAQPYSFSSRKNHRFH